MAVAVTLHAEKVHGEADPRFTHGYVVVLGHVMDCRVRVVGTGHGVDGYRHRDGASGTNQRRRALDVLRGDVVQGTPLVVSAPAAPVLDGVEHRLELVERDVQSSLTGLWHQRTAPGRGVSISPGSGSPIDSAPSTTNRCPDR